MNEDEISRKIFDNWKMAVLFKELDGKKIDNKKILEITDNELYAGCLSENIQFPYSMMF